MLTNKRLLSSLNVAVTRYVQTKTAKALRNMCTHQQQQGTTCNVEQIVSRTKEDMAADIAALRQDLTKRMAELEQDVRCLTQNAGRDSMRIDIRFEHIYAVLDGRNEELQNRLYTSTSKLHKKANIHSMKKTVLPQTQPTNTGRPRSKQCRLDEPTTTATMATKMTLTMHPKVVRTMVPPVNLV